MRLRFGRKARFAATVLTGGVLAAAAGCSDPGGTSAGSAPPARTLAPDPGDGAHPAAAWPTYGRDLARSGVAAGVAAPGRLTVSWRAHLDGAVYGQPLLVGTMVIAATENDSIYGLDQATGRVIWRRHVGTPVPLADLPCGNIDPLGITGTPVYDPASGLVYAVAETSGYHHVLVGVSAVDGSLQVERDIPTPDGQPRYDQQRPGLTIEARAGVRGVRRAVRGLRAVPRLGGGHPAQRDRTADLLRGADRARGRRLGHRRPGHRPGRHHVRQRRATARRPAPASTTATR